MREIQPISGACVWHGRKMASSSRWRRQLSDAQLVEIDRVVRQASARGLGWQTMTADDFPLPSCAALAEDIRAELEDGSGIVLLQGLDPLRYSVDELKLLYAAISRTVVLERDGFEPSVPRCDASSGWCVKRATGCGMGARLS